MLKRPTASMRVKINLDLAKRRNSRDVNRRVIAVKQQRLEACAFCAPEVFFGAVAHMENLFRRRAQHFGRVLKNHRLRFGKAHFARDNNGLKIAVEPQLPEQRAEPFIPV